MTSSHTGLYFSNKVHTFRAASSSVKFGTDFVDFDDSVVTGYAETGSFVTESAFVVEVIKSSLCPDDDAEACVLKMFNNVSIGRDSCCLFSKAFAGAANFTHEWPKANFIHESKRTLHTIWRCELYTRF